MPLLAILSAGVASHAMSGSFEFAYPLRLIVGTTVIFAYRRELRSINWAWSWRGPLVGTLVFLLWLAAAYALLPHAMLPNQLMGVSPTLRVAWIASRLLTSLTIIPLAEELAYRGYLMRRLGRADFESVPYRTTRWSSLVISAIVFGLAHGSMWLPGIVAGLAYGLLARHTNRLGDAVVAHATSNALLAAMVLIAGMWELW
jgi:CAAX prenyl protease-like protein